MTPILELVASQVAHLFRVPLDHWIVRFVLLQLMGEVR